jgi:hypothetical protein
MQPEELRDDLKAEVILVVCEIDESRLQQMQETGGLVFFVVRIILNMVKSTTSKFYKKYRVINLQLEPIYDTID